MLLLIVRSLVFPEYWYELCFKGSRTRLEMRPLSTSNLVMIPLSTLLWPVSVWSRMLPLCAPLRKVLFAKTESGEPRAKFPSLLRWYGRSSHAHHRMSFLPYDITHETKWYCNVDSKVRKSAYFLTTLPCLSQPARRWTRNSERALWMISSLPVLLPRSWSGEMLAGTRLVVTPGFNGNVI